MLPIQTFSQKQKKQRCSSIPKYKTEWTPELICLGFQQHQQKKTQKTNKKDIFDTLVGVSSNISIFYNTTPLKDKKSCATYYPDAVYKKCSSYDCIRNKDIDSGNMIMKVSADDYTCNFLLLMKFLCDNFSRISVVSSSKSHYILCVGKLGKILSNGGNEDYNIREDYDIIQFIREIKHGNKL